MDGNTTVIFRPTRIKTLALPISARPAAGFSFSLASASIGCVVSLCVLPFPLRVFGVSAASAHDSKL